ncbi:hypothetical protein B0I72DRAFT_135216 [Yarrowia lipolytica]|nr:hypothetical protein B0I72DRAFT_135216 [Yarrowia lipolytica]RDW39828.1 hypothetical protein B0I73DRAFT_131328 [Yarrowia lipolytica]
MSLAAPKPLALPAFYDSGSKMPLGHDVPKKRRGRPRKRRLDAGDSFSSATSSDPSSSPLLSTDGAAAARTMASPTTTPTKKRKLTAPPPQLSSSPPMAALRSFDTPSSPPPRPHTPPGYETVLHTPKQLSKHHHNASNHTGQPTTATNETPRSRTLARFETSSHVNPSLIYASATQPMPSASFSDLPSSPTFASSSSIMSPQTPRNGFSFSTIMASSPLYHGYFTSPAQNDSPGGSGLVKLSVKPMPMPSFKKDAEQLSDPFKNYQVRSGPLGGPLQPLEQSPVQIKRLEIKRRISLNISATGKASVGIADERPPHMTRSYYTDPDRENIDKLFPELSPRQVVPEDDDDSSDDDDDDTRIGPGSSRRSESQDPLSDAKAALQSMMKSGRTSTSQAASRAGSPPQWSILH